MAWESTKTDAAAGVGGQGAGNTFDGAARSAALAKPEARAALNRAKNLGALCKRFNRWSGKNKHEVSRSWRRPDEAQP